MALGRTIRPLTGERVVVRLAEQSDGAAIAGYFRTNEEHLSAFTPSPAEFSSAVYWPEQIPQRQNEFAAGTGCKAFVFATAGLKPPIGTINLHPIMRGPFQAAYVGYSLAASHEGQGFMREALALCIAFAFDELRLHRLMANYMPANLRSGALLARLGFSVEGYAKRYLRVNGVWQDHVLTSLTNERWQG